MQKMCTIKHRQHLSLTVCVTEINWQDVTSHVYVLYKILYKLVLDSSIFFYSNILFADYIIEMWQKQIFAVKYYMVFLFYLYS